VPTNKQRREAARRHLERQIQRRQERDAARRRFTLIASIVSTVVVVAVIVIVVVVVTGGSSKHKSTAADNPTVSSPATTPTATPTPSVSYKPATGKAVSFEGVTVKGATDLKGYPVVTSKSSKNATGLLVKDLVVGKGKAATSTSSVTVQYVGVLYKNGTKFDASWDRGQPASFSLNGGVIKGFQEGIGGTKGVAPMHVGGRRIIIMPASLGYGAAAQGSIPANSSLVFVVDLTAIG
jgi:peptidylprolyl isomerase